MDSLDFLKPTAETRREITAGTAAEVKVAALALIKEMAQGSINSPRYIEPLDDGATQPPHVRAMDENGDILQVNIIEVAPAQYELHFTRYTIDDKKLRRRAKKHDIS